MVLEELLVGVGVPLLRNLAGWLENSLEDGKVTLYEWKRLVKTILRLGVPGLALYWGFSLSPEMSAVIPLVVDYLFNYIKKVVVRS